MSTDTEDKPSVSPEDVELAEKFKNEANEYFKSKFSEFFYLFELLE